MIYWVAIQELPTSKQVKEESALPKLVLAPVAVEARDDKDAAIKVALDNPSLKSVNKERMQVVVRPF